MPTIHLFGRPLLLFLLLLFKNSTSDETTPLPISVVESTTQTPQSPDVSDYSTESQYDDKYSQSNDSVSSSSTESFFPTAIVDPERYVCPQGFKQLTSDWCFHLSYNTERRLSFEEAQAYCGRRHAILPAISSAKVTTALMEERTTNMDISPFEPFFIGLDCNISNHHWMWIGGPEFDPNEAFFERELTSPYLCNRLEFPFVFDQFGTWSYLADFIDQALTVCAVRPEGYAPPTPPSPNQSDYSTTNHNDDNPDQPNESLTGSTDYYSEPTVDPERYVCPEGFKQLTIDWCFHLKFDTDNPMNFTVARDYCSKMDAILPAITSVEVTTALMLERTTKMGISPFEAFYIGLGCNTTSHRWQWIDGPEYDPSDAFFQRELTSPEYCSFIDQPFVFNQYGTWSHANNFLEQNLAVCAMRPKGYSPPVPIDSPCAEDQWTQLPGGFCYRLSVEPQMDIYDAEMKCRNHGGHLPSIKSSAQSDLIQAYLSGKSYTNSQFWIGLYCIWDDDEDLVAASSKKGKRAWIDGTPYTEDYTNFLDENDDTDTCTVGLVDTFAYNAALKGKWQKQKFNWTLSVLMCTRPDPEPIQSTTTPTTTRRTTTKTTLDPSEVTTDEDPDNPDPTTTIITTTTSPRNHQLTRLELILIISLACIIIVVVIVILLYFLCKRIRKERVQEIVANMQKRFSRSNTNVIVKIDEWEIKRQFVGIDYSRQLGRGAFGSVYLGRVFSENIPDKAVKTLLQLNSLKKDDDRVAVKTLHETADRQASIEFAEEIEIMKKIGFHERLVNLLACVTETEPLLLIVEYCSNGDLLRFMRERRSFMLKLKDTVGESIAERHSIITVRQQLMFGIQIAYGMEYLTQRGFVHRDLAARNILVDQNETCKIGDFGLCRQIGEHSEQYISRGGRLPFKWMAPEALERFYFSVESDVWSFGVLLFEIITLGGNPYPDWAAVELLYRLKSGERMPKPDGCSEAVYELMLGCWRGIPMQRLSFEKIRRKLAQELEEASGEDYYLKLDAAAKYYQETLEFDRNVGRFNSF